MGVKSTAEGGEKKTVVKHEGPLYNLQSGQHNANCRGNHIKKEKFLVADPDLHRHVFKAKRNRSEQVADFTTVNNIIKAQVGSECDTFVLQYLEQEAESGPKEPAPVSNEDGATTKTKEMKCKSKYDKYLNRIHKDEMQLKQTYFKQYGQIDEEMKGSLT